ncbi:hypothetical protein U9M48_011916 [Paspalum notatum var. saurae]|uniref:Retrotransposon protein, putative, Ty1-copia subclass n=1 Tax=Paspalum notatum var. saurae TaxID=547442 RepID=A0AAQ3SWS0_PASNO
MAPSDFGTVIAGNGATLGSLRAPAAHREAGVTRRRRRGGGTRGSATSASMLGKDGEEADGARATDDRTRREEAAIPQEGKIPSPRPPELVHGDCVGQSGQRRTAAGGTSSLVDDHGRYMWLRLLIIEAIKEIKARAEARDGEEAALATNEREEASSHLWSSAASRGGRRGTPPLGAILTTGERRGREEEGRSSAWHGACCGVRGEAVTTAVYILNRASTKALDGQTPFEAWHGRKPDVSHLRTFGCVGYVKVTKPGVQARG